MDETLTGAGTPGQGRTENNGNGWVFHTLHTIKCSSLDALRGKITLRFNRLVDWLFLRPLNFAVSFYSEVSYFMPIGEGKQLWSTITDSKKNFTIILNR